MQSVKNLLFIYIFSFYHPQYHDPLCIQHALTVHNSVSWSCTANKVLSETKQAISSCPFKSVMSDMNAVCCYLYACCPYTLGSAHSARFRLLLHQKGKSRNGSRICLELFVEGIKTVNCDCVNAIYTVLHSWRWMTVEAAHMTWYLDLKLQLCNKR